MREIISTLERSRGKIDLRSFELIVSAIDDLGYKYQPRRMRGKRWKVSEVLPPIIEGLEKADLDVEARDVRDALRRGGVRA